jgi:hypothetical protein
MGYLAFPETAVGSLLSIYPKSGGLSALRILMAVSVLLSYPIILFPTRENVDKLMFSGQKSCFPHRPLTNFRFYSQNIFLVWIACAITIAIPQFRTILNLWGAFTGTFLGYIFPTVFYLKSSKMPFRDDVKAWGAATMLVVGALSGFVRHSAFTSVKICFQFMHDVVFPHVFLFQTSLYFVIADQVKQGSL